MVAAGDVEFRIEKKLEAFGGVVCSLFLYLQAALAASVIAFRIDDCIFLKKDDNKDYKNGDTCITCVQEQKTRKFNSKKGVFY